MIELIELVTIVGACALACGVTFTFGYWGAAAVHWVCVWVGEKLKGKS